MPLTVKSAQTYVKEQGLTKFAWATVDREMTQSIESFRNALQALRANLNPQIRAINEIYKTYWEPIKAAYQQMQTGQLGPGMTEEIARNAINGLNQATQLAQSLSQGEQQDAAALQQLPGILQAVRQSLDAGLQPQIMNQEATGTMTGQQPMTDQQAADQLEGAQPTGPIQPARDKGRYTQQPGWGNPSGGPGAVDWSKGPGNVAPAAAQPNPGLWERTKNFLNQPRRLPWQQPAMGASGKPILTAGAGSATY